MANWWVLDGQAMVKRWPLQSTDNWPSSLVATSFDSGLDWMGRKWNDPWQADEGRMENAPIQGGGMIKADMDELA